MADLFLSYARADQDRAAAISRELEGSGRSLWWDRRLSAGEDYGTVIEREIAAAKCVIVAWSGTARDSLWVRAEASEALDQDKLVQLNLDGSRLPLPFTMLHFLDFRSWVGGREQAPWPELEARLEGQLRGEGGSPVGVRPNAGGVPMESAPEPALQGFATIAMIGWAGVGAALLVGLCVLLAVRNQLTAEALGLISIVALAVSLALLAVSGFVLARALQASRR